MIRPKRGSGGPDPIGTGSRRARITGWAAVAISTLLAGFWAFWGIIENFHEGWYDARLAANLLMMFGQYLMPLFVIVGAGVIGICLPRVGGVLHAAGGIAASRFFDTRAGLLFIGLPLIALGALYAFGQARPRRWALAALLGVPLIVLVVAGAEPVIRVAGRIDDGDRSARVVPGNAVRLLWAAQGPGWPERGGVSWEDAQQRCAHLTAAGAADSVPHGIWRLPTVDEAVRSMARHGRNAGGTWDAAARRARYDVRPDKESPLWDSRSLVIYWWTGTPISATDAWMITYAGGVFARSKTRQPDYFGYRCVREP